MRRAIFGLLVLLVAIVANANSMQAQAAPNEACTRPAVGSEVPEPLDLRSTNGVLKVELTYRNYKDAAGRLRFCYVFGNGDLSPNLRLKPGDLLILDLKNEMTELAGTSASSATMPMPEHKPGKAAASGDPCVSGVMSSTSTNLHFHGLTIPPVCHQDEVLKTSIQAGSAPFEYKFKIPADEQPGLYWYHPHLHGFSKVQVLGGASGALIVEGLERVNTAAAGLPERVFVIRDEDLLNPKAPPSKSEPVIPRMLIDHDGDTANTGTGSGTPAKDLSINFVSVPYPDYPTAIIKMKSGQPQLWRVVNASAITYLNLQVLFDRKPQMMDIVALDGVAVNADGVGPALTVARNHMGIPPGGRAEFIVKPPDASVQSALLVCRTVNTGPGGENDPNRALATIVATENAPEPQSTMPSGEPPLAASTLPWLGGVAPVRTRKLYFSETLQDPNDPNSPTTFFITVDGAKPEVFDPHSDIPAIVAHQGDVEDWIIENRSSELHAFHIHQIHFLLTEWNDIQVNEPYLRDTVNVPFYDGKALQYPSIKVRMDFRDPNTIGTFVFHCHLLEHEDNGMMGLIRVDPPEHAQANLTTAAARSSVPVVSAKR
ncbi:MAG TPA: multicopper oxidase domain-containing protein [Candidatus Acidoferrales bacterium]